MTRFATACLPFFLLFAAATATAQLPDWLQAGRMGARTELLPGGKSFKIVQCVPNSPAERAGLQPGDVVVAVNDAPFQFPHGDSIAPRLKGAVGSEVTLVLVGGKRVAVVREALNLPASMGGPCQSGDCQNGEGVLHYPTPAGYGYYKGRFRLGLPEGEGSVFVSASLTGETLYTGTFALGLYNGQGKGVFDLLKEIFGGTTALYEGAWAQGQPAGKGKMTFADGTVLTGDFRPDAVFNATFIMPSGRRYENGMAFGYNEICCLKKGTKEMYWYELEAGTETPASTCLSGDCANGSGEYRWWDGMTYKGTFKNGFRHGKGTQKKPDGTVHEGEFFHDYPHGAVTTRYNEGSVFVGNYFWDKRHGHGKLTYQNGSVFEGEYRDNEPNGFGTFIYQNGNTYEGDFADGKRHGHGVLYRKDLDKTFTGEFRNDQLHGVVEVLRPGGSVEVWEFREGSPYKLSDYRWSQADWQRNEAQREQESKVQEQQRKQQDADREARWKSPGGGDAPIGKVTAAQVKVALNDVFLAHRIFDEVGSNLNFTSNIRPGDYVSYGNTMTWLSINSDDVLQMTRRLYESNRIILAYFEQRGDCPPMVSLLSDTHKHLTAALDDATRCKEFAKASLAGPSGSAATDYLRRNYALGQRMVSVDEKYRMLWGVYEGCGGR